MSADVVVTNSNELVSLLEQLPEGVFVLDNEQKILFANKPGLRLVKIKAKNSVGERFPFPLEDGTMRDFDVEMLVKEIAWLGEDSKLIHLKPLKSAGAFHLEWKLESALERARSAELLLEQWRSRESQQPTAGETDTSNLEKTKDLLTAAQNRETDLSEKLEEYQQTIAHQREEFDERLGELESLLEMAETRADELQSEVVTGDHKSAVELQRAVSQAREAEEQSRTLEDELTEARNRVRVAEEQAEVAEERAYALETEIERLASETEDAVSRSETEELQQELAELRAQLAERDGESGNADEQASRIETLEQELADKASSYDEEIALLVDRIEAKEMELLEIRSRLSANEQEFAILSSRLSSKEDELVGVRLELSQQASFIESNSDTSTLLESSLTELRSDLESSRQMAERNEASRQQLETELTSLQAKLLDAEEILRLRSEESDELAEQLRSETEESEETLARLREENDGLLESLREQAEELESLRDIAADAETLVEEFGELRDEHEQLLAVQAKEVEELRAKLAELEPAASDAERLQNEVQKLTAHLDEVGAQAEKGERAEKLERKLEGALRRAEEAEERLNEERRLLAELRQTSERRIGELESRQGGAGFLEQNPEMDRITFQDPLTGLPNASILHRYLSFMLKQSVRYDRYTALLRVDCDDLRTIREQYGTELGDRILRLLGERLSAVVRSSDVLGRLGEAEFAILLSELTDQKEASVVTASVIKRIYQILKKPFAVDDQNISISVSIGVSLFPLDASNGEQMFQHAASALERAKETGKGRAQYFTTEVQSTHEARMQLDQELKLGLERGEFGLVYQPIFDLSNAQAVGVEALIRWHHPQHGLVGPEDFLKVAEESGIIVLIGNWAMRTAIQKAAQWQQAGLGTFVSLNLSRRQLLQADLVATVHSILAEFRCSADRVLLEVSEELSGPEFPRLRETLVSLQQLGVRLAVDNFGTSTSSLQELRRGPFQVIKIDRRFVRGLPTNEENAGIVMSALTIGHHLSRISVAVGVETEAEKTWLAKTGCRFAQGNLLSPPLTAEQISELVARR